MIYRLYKNDVAFEHGLNMGKFHSHVTFSYFFRCLEELATREQLNDPGL